MIVNYIKKELILFLTVFTIFGVTFYLYQTRSMDISNKEERVTELEKRLESDRKRSLELASEYRKNEEFLRTHPNVRLIPSKSKEFGDYVFERDFGKVLSLFFGKSARMRMNHRPKRTGNYLSYRVSCEFPYENPERTRKFFSFLKNNYIYSLRSLEIRNGKFRATCEFIGKE